jgi:hypothetical protein
MPLPAGAMFIAANICKFFNICSFYLKMVCFTRLLPYVIKLLSSIAQFSSYEITFVAQPKRVI